VERQMSQHQEASPNNHDQHHQPDQHRQCQPDEQTFPELDGPALGQSPRREASVEPEFLGQLSQTMIETVDFLHNNIFVSDDVEASVCLTELLVYLSSRVIGIPTKKLPQVITKLSDLTRHYCEQFIRLAGEIPDEAAAEHLLKVVKRQVSQLQKNSFVIEA
jgi:hypothetical protein